MSFSNPERPSQLPNIETREGKLVKIRLLRKLYFGGVLKDEGDIVTVRESSALDLQVIKRAVIVK